MISLIQDDKGTLSMSKVLLLGSFFVSSWVLIVQVHKGDVGEGVLGVYLAAFAASYVGGKFADRRKDGTTSEILENSGRGDTCLRINCADCQNQSYQTRGNGKRSKGKSEVPAELRNLKPSKRKV